MYSIVWFYTIVVFIVLLYALRWLIWPDTDMTTWPGFFKPFRRWWLKRADNFWGLFIIACVFVLLWLSLLICYP